VGHQQRGVPEVEQAHLQAPVSPVPPGDDVLRLEVVVDHPEVQVHHAQGAP
jgi:hypothetical protein